jgi:Zn2+/Cd2+-exporting ATPase
MSSSGVSDTTSRSTASDPNPPGGKGEPSPEGREGGPGSSTAAAYLRVTIVVSVGMVLGALLTWVPDEPSLWSWLPLGVAYLVGGVPIVRETVATLKEGRLSIDFLMGAAALGAAGVGQPLEGVILIFLFSLSNTLEAYALGRTRRAIGGLMKLHPEEATLVDDTGAESGRVSTDTLNPGQRIRVRPGERIAADGRVVSGRSEVDQSAITGEATPVLREADDEVFAGTINGGGVLTVEVTRPAGETMLARIVRMVEDARGEQAPAQEFIDRFAHPYTLLVLGGSALTAVVAALFFQMTWSDAVYRAMTLLVVASPCALVISTPSAVLSAIANGARRGVLFKGGGILDLAGTVDVVAFDKTGTLTVGEPRLLASVPAPGWDTGELLRLVAGVEAASEHHLARAILQAAWESELTVPPAEDFHAIPGEGVEARVDGRSVWVGNPVMARRQGAQVSDELAEWLETQGAKGRSVVLAGTGPELMGAMAFGDELRTGAAELVADLRAEGIRKILILSGDHQRAVQVIAREIGADEALGELLPDQKVDALRALARDSQGVLMVGDGVNDAPAMAAASVGVAMGAAGTDVAIETADVVLMSDELDKVRDLINLGRRSRRVVRQNVWFSVGWMAILVVVASTIGIPLTLAVVAHEGSTLLVVLNGLRLLGGGGLSS